MESSSHITGDGGDEGCNSSESGWTMYLVSPLHGDDSGGSKGSGSEGSSVDDGYGYIISDRRSRKAYEDEAEDDDSLASDASTGPAKVKVTSMQEDHNEDGGRGKSGHGEGGGGGGKEEEEDDDVRTKLSTSSRKKAGKVDRGGEGKSSRKGHGKRGSSSRTSFFFW
ncbi:hypothetical protein ACP4OV_017867 [Aristida adscensionis]